ncbi:MAG: hypothetical protein HY390_06325 [Deltaproteobacteria bacterium]|nr:hypothetical protein [Deltaproteobacteria bacterium]
MSWNNIRIMGGLVVVSLVIALYLRHTPNLKQTQPMPTLSTPSAKNQGNAPYVEGEVLVKFKPNTSGRIILKWKEILKVTQETYLESIQVYQWKGNFKTQEAIHLLTQSKEVVYAEPNYTVSIQKPSK